MTSPWSNPDSGPAPEQLAAYADGELDANERTRIETWLTNHPDAAVEIEAWRQLATVWHATAAPEPSPKAWEAVRANIEKSLAAPRRGGRRPWWATLGLGVAAAALIAILLARLLWPGSAPEEPEEPFPVVEAGEVNIISLDPRDGDAVVVDHSSVLGAVEFAAPDDVTVVKVEPRQAEGSAAYLEEGAVPVMWPGEEETSREP